MALSRFIRMTGCLFWQSSASVILAQVEIQSVNRAASSRRLHRHRSRSQGDWRRERTGLGWRDQL